MRPIISSRSVSAAAREPRRVRAGFAFVAPCLLALALTGCGGGGSNDPSSAKSLQRLTVTPASATTYGAGTPVQFKAEATYSDGTTQDVTQAASWGSSNTGVATISNTAPASGLVTTVAALGATAVSAALDGMTSAVALNVKAGGSASEVYSFAGGAADGSTPTDVILANDGNFYGTTALGGANGRGTVYRLNPRDNTETILYSFGANDPGDGYGPVNLIQATDNNLYGVTQSGGANGGGTVFKLTLAGNETSLYSFAAGTRSFGIVQASDGNFYATTLAADFTSAVLRITPDGVQTVIHTSNGLIDGESSLIPLVANEDYLYGAGSNGGPNGGGTLFKLALNGQFTTMHAFTLPVPGPDGAAPVGLVQAADGNFYGMASTTNDGVTFISTVYRATPEGAVTTLYTFNPANGVDGNNGTAPPLRSLIQGSDGNLYGINTQDGAKGHGTLFQVTPGGIEKVIYAFDQDPIGLLTPNLVFQGPNGGLYLMTANGGAGGFGEILKVD